MIRNSWRMAPLRLASQALGLLHGTAQNMCSAYSLAVANQLMGLEIKLL